METPAPNPKTFSPTKAILSLTLVLLAVLGFIFYQRHQQAQKGMVRTDLLPLTFQPLPLGSVKPSGWLLDQLKLQAGGLTGHLDEFWPDVKDSGWIGGKAEGWERAPYWLDGMIPLAFLTDDPKLKAKAKRWVDYILAHQLADGWLGPEKSPPPTGARFAEGPAPRDPWPQFIILKALAQYQEATGDPRIIPAMRNELMGLNYQLDQRPLFNWNFFRWGDLLVSIFWLFDRTHDPWLLDMARKVASQGYNWPKHFSDLPVKGKSPRWNWEGHVVNNAMGIKAPALLWRLTDNGDFKKSALGALEELDRYHGQANGLFSGDECLAGKNPSQGTELCAVVETMFSLENLVSVLGNVEFADRLEKVAFNALPAACTPDYWGHQYDQQANQVACVPVTQPIYTTNGPPANLFGLEPQFGCCTANFHQGWPKFVSHLWMATPDDGLAAVAYGPSVVKTEINGELVEVELTTDYPFSEELEFQVRVPKPLSFPLYLRVPEWAEGAVLTYPTGGQESLRAGTFHKVLREWADKDVIRLRLPMGFHIRRGFQDSVSVERGPLVYSLAIQEQWRPLVPYEFQPKGLKKNYYAVLPLSDWNYGLALDVHRPENSLALETRPMNGNPFTPEGTPVRIAAKGKLLDFWAFANGAAQPPPPSPVDSASPLKDLVLIPYGSARLRVTEFPLLK